MKLVIQIPCFNEEESLGITLAALPTTVIGFDSIEIIVVDDGSTDRTVEVAQSMGVRHIIRHVKNRGLAQAYLSGLKAGITLGADVIVNTDADNQYNAADIQILVGPILEFQADLVVGARPIGAIAHFSTLKKLLQKVGSWTVRIVSQTEVADAPSGFRAISRKAAQQTFVFNQYTYTLETIIQAGQKNMAVVSVPIRVNGDLRPSRLVKSNFSYIVRSIATIIRIFVIYRPMLFFGAIGTALFGSGLLIGARFVYLYALGFGQGHIQSLILASVLMGIGFQTLLVAFVSDLLSANRKLLENIRFNMWVDKDRAKEQKNGGLEYG
jgi:glycosyltransferase involved in cell wall biosynthesis